MYILYIIYRGLLYLDFYISSLAKFPNSSFSNERENQAEYIIRPQNRLKTDPTPSQQSGWKKKRPRREGGGGGGRGGGVPPNPLPLKCPSSP